MKKSKIEIVIQIVILIIVLLLFSFFGIAYKIQDDYNKKIQNENEIINKFSYYVYNTVENMANILVTVNSENGLEYVEYPDSNRIFLEGRKTISFDYLAEKDLNLTFKIKEMYNEKGEAVESTPHPKERLFIKTDGVELKEFELIRKRL